MGLRSRPDESTLYVADPGLTPEQGGARIMRYDLPAPGSPTNGEVFLPWFADGLKVDAFGNLFAAVFRGFAAVTPEGEMIFWEQTPQATTNLAFEDPNGIYPNRLYVTAAGSLYRVDIPSLSDFPSDFTGDGIVDEKDLQEWQSDYGINGTSDTNGDGQSNGTDFLIWQRGFEAAASSAPNAIPEPASILLIGLFISAASVVRKRRIVRSRWIASHPQELAFPCK